VAKAASTGEAPGLTRRDGQVDVRVGMLPPRCSSGARPPAAAGQGRPGRRGRRAPGGLGAAAAAARAATRPTRAVATAARAARPSPPEIPPKGWLDIAKRTAKEVKADQVPLLSAGLPSTPCCRCSRPSSPGVSVYGLVADPATVRDQIANLTKLLSPETGQIVGSRSSR
jgi:membrane protein